MKIKHVEMANVCPLCQYEDELEIHVLVQCPFARSCWREAFDHHLVSNTDSFVE